MSQIPHFQFGTFTLNMANMQLLQNGQLVSNDDKIVKALLLLCEHYPKAVDKDLMLTTLWPSQIVTDWSISKLISEIRHVLGDNGKDQDYIKTVRGQGFRMNIPVNQVAPSHSKSSKLNDSHRETTSPRFKWFKHVGLSLLMSVIVIGTLTYVYLNSERGNKTVNTSSRIAVLPVSINEDSSVHSWVTYGVMALVAEQISQYPSIKIIPIDKVVASVPDPEKATFSEVCGQLGCSQMVFLSFDLVNNQPTMNFTLIDEKGKTSSRPFVGVDVIDSANGMLEVLTTSLIPRDQFIIPLETRFSENTKANRDYAIGVHSILSGEFKDARSYLNLALEKEPDFFWAKAYLAELSYRVGELEQSSAFIAELQENKLNDEQAFFLQNLQSNILYAKGDIFDSLAMSLALKVNPYVLSDPLLMGNQSLNVGSSLQALGKLQDAIPHFIEASRYYKEAKFGSGEGKVLFNLGNVYLTNSEIPKAVDYYQQARDIFIRYGLTGYSLLARHQLATTSLQLGKVQNVESELFSLIKAYQKIGDVEGEMTAYNDLALVSMIEKDYQQAAQRAQNALRNLENSEFSYLKNHAIHLGAKAFLMMKNAQQAETLLGKIEGEWNDQRPGYSFIKAHLTLVKGDTELALNQAQTMKQSMGEAWTSDHELVLQQFVKAKNEKKVLELSY